MNCPAPVSVLAYVRADRGGTRRAVSPGGRAPGWSLPLIVAVVAGLLAMHANPFVLGPAMPSSTHAAQAGQAVTSSTHAARAGQAVTSSTHAVRAGQAVTSSAHTAGAGQAATSSAHTAQAGPADEGGGSADCPCPGDCDGGVSACPALTAMSWSSAHLTVDLADVATGGGAPAADDAKPLGRTPVQPPIGLRVTAVTVTRI